MKEEDARKKWCPMVKMVAVDHNNRVLNSAAFNKCSRENQAGKHFEPDGSSCIASECMMWVQTDNECDPMPGPPKGTSAVQEEPKYYPAGYCGLIK